MTVELAERWKARGGRWAKIAIFNLGESYYAIENTCPHRGGPVFVLEAEAQKWAPTPMLYFRTMDGYGALYYK